MKELLLELLTTALIVCAICIITYDYNNRYILAAWILQLTMNLNNYAKGILKI